MLDHIAIHRIHAVRNGLVRQLPCPQFLALQREIDIREEILFFNADPAETEFLEDFHQSLGVRFAHRNKETHIPCVSRKSVKADRVASYDEILNGLFFQ